MSLLDHNFSYLQHLLTLPIFISDVPSAPGKPDVTEVDSTLIGLHWSQPESDGGSPITSYIIEKRDKPTARWMRATKETVTKTDFTVTDLFEGKTYEFRVAATNKAGTGPFSEPSEPTTCKPPYGKLFTPNGITNLCVLNKND